MRSYAFLFILLSAGMCLGQSWDIEDNPRLIGENKTVTVLRGQSLYEIARGEGYALEHLAEANGLPVSLAAVQRATVVVPSQRILPPDPPTEGIVVNIPERGFYVFKKESQPRFFPVAVGEPGRFETPVGRYAIREKVVDPEWIAPEWAGLGEDNVIPAGPNNPLGDRWIGLTASGLGMHSTNNPSSIGSATSHGCMRMYPEVARTVFDLVESGWPVTIEYETSRVTAVDSGVFVSCFPDPYNKKDESEQLLENFRELDLFGFFSLIDQKKLLQKPSGMATKVVDLEPTVVVYSESRHPAARVAQQVFLEAETLVELEIQQSFNLAERTATLTKGDKSVSLPLRLDTGENPSQTPQRHAAFLSRGTAWFPVKEALQPFDIPYKWVGSSKTLLVTR